MKRAKRLTGLAVVAMATGCLAGEGLPQAEVILGETRVKLTLEDNPAARALLERLPLTLQFRDFNGTEKIAMLDEPLPMQGSPRACTPKAGMVAYYAPWGNLCFFYRDFRHSPGLVPLGRVDVAALQLSGRADFFTMTLAPIPAAAAERTERAAAQ